MITFSGEVNNLGTLKTLLIVSAIVVLSIFSINPSTHANPFERGEINLGNSDNVSPQDMTKNPILLTLGVWNIRIVANFEPAFVKDGAVIGCVNLDGEKGWVPLKQGDFIQVENREKFSGKGWLIPNIKELNKHIELTKEFISKAT